MYTVLFIVFASMLGAAFGSFACCQAWRIRLKEEKKEDPGKRSVCVKCGHKLRWFENIPILSWLAQGGKCRKCGARIGKAEILAEVLGALMFGLFAWKFVSGLSPDLGLVEFIGEIDWPGLVAILATTVGLLILAVYDGKWGEMPVGILIYTIVMSLVFAVLKNELLPTVFSVALLAGTYYLLYFFSKERLVGGGDWMLCLAIGLILGKWQLALVELFLANFLGALAMLPQKKKKMAFGPFLVVAFVVVFMISDWLLKTLTMELK